MRENQYNDFIYTDYQKRKSGLTKEQIEVLASIYCINKKPTTFERIEMAEKLGVQEYKIKNWFQNRRAKDKKQFKETIMAGMHDLNSRDTPKVYPGCSDLYRRRNR